MANWFLGFPVSKAKFAEVAAAVQTALNLENYAVFLSYFESLNGWSEDVAASGTVELDYLKVVMSTNGGAASRASVYKGIDYPFGTLTWAKNRTLKLKAKVTRGDEAANNLLIAMGSTISGNNGAGFRFINGKVQGFLGNASGQEFADLVTGLSTPYAQTAIYKIKWTAGQKAEFYMDGVLKGTLSTKLPIGTGNASELVALRCESTDAVTHSIETSQVLFQQDLI